MKIINQGENIVTKNMTFPISKTFTATETNKQKMLTWYQYILFVPVLGYQFYILLRYTVNYISFRNL